MGKGAGDTGGEWKDGTEDVAEAGCDALVGVIAVFAVAEDVAAGALVLIFITGEIRGGRPCSTREAAVAAAAAAGFAVSGAAAVGTGRGGLEAEAVAAMGVMEVIGVMVVTVAAPAAVRFCSSALPVPFITMLAILSIGLGVTSAAVTGAGAAAAAFFPAAASGVMDSAGLLVGGVALGTMRVIGVLAAVTGGEVLVADAAAVVVGAVVAAVGVVLVAWMTPVVRVLTLIAGRAATAAAAAACLPLVGLCTSASLSFSSLAARSLWSSFSFAPSSSSSSAASCGSVRSSSSYNASSSSNSASR